MKGIYMNISRNNKIKLPQTHAPSYAHIHIYIHVYNFYYKLLFLLNVQVNFNKNTVKAKQLD